MDEREPSTPAARAGAWLAVLAIAVMVARLLVPSLAEVGYQPWSDDGYYLRYMSEVSSRGLGALPGQFLMYLGDQRHWIFPPPSRVGFTLVSALFALVFGARVETLSYLSLASHLALIVVQFAFARRWFGEAKAVLVAALTAFSPLYLGLSRLALTDAFISLSQTVAIWTFLEYVRAPHSRKHRLAFALAFFLAVLTKEISVLLAIPFAAYAAIERFHRGRDVRASSTALLLCAPVVACVFVWIAAAGGPIPLFKVMKIVMLSPSTNEYALAYGGGGWSRYPVDELLMSPWPTLLGLAAIAVAAWRWKQGEYGSLAVAMALVYLCQIAALSPFTKNLRYVAVLEVPLRVLAVVLLWEVLRPKRWALGAAACALVIALLCWSGYSDYELFWLRWKTYDPVSTVLTSVRGLVPAPPEPAK